MIDPYKVKYYETEVKTFWQKNNHTIILWGGIAVLLIGVAIYYTKCGPDKQVKGIVTPDVIIKKEVQKVVDSKKVDSLEKVIAQKDLVKTDLMKRLTLAQAYNDELRKRYKPRTFNIPDYILPNQTYNLPLHFTDEIHDTTIYDIGVGGSYVDSIPQSVKNIIPIWPIGSSYSDHTKDDYIQQLQDGAYTSDSLCNEVQKQWVDISEVKDSTIKVLKSDKRILISSFNDLGYNSTMKDKAIKDLNRSLRWQKVQKYALLGALGYVAFKTLTK